MLTKPWPVGEWVEKFMTDQLYSGDNCNDDWPQQVGWTDWYCTLSDLVEFTEQMGYLLSFIKNKHLLEEFFILFEHCVPFLGRKEYFLVEFVPLNGELKDCIRLRVDYTGWFYKYTVDSERTNKVVAYTQGWAARLLEATAKLIKEV